MRTQALRSTAVARRRGVDVWVASVALLTLALFLLVAGLLYLRLASSVATGGYDVLRLEAERARWETMNSQLSYRVAELSSMARVERDARAQLGMDLPENTVYLRVTKPGSGR